MIELMSSGTQFSQDASCPERSRRAKWNPGKWRFKNPDFTLLHPGYMLPKTMIHNTATVRFSLPGLRRKAATSGLRWLMPASMPRAIMLL